MRNISNLDLKIKLTNEYLKTGGLEKIAFKELLQSFIDIKFDKNGKAIPNSVSPLANSFMMLILKNHLSQPFISPKHSSEYLSTLQKSLNFNQINIDTKEQFDEVYKKYLNTEEYLFRGQREAKWRLYSRLQRLWLEEKLYESEINYLDFIKKMIDNGRKYYKKEIEKIVVEKNIDTLNDLSILSFLQHYGCPTPLLDWTYSFKNALFFGVDNLQENTKGKEIEEYFSVFFIKEKDFESGGLREVINQSLDTISDDYLNKAISLIAKDKKTEKEMQIHFKGRSFFDKDKFKGAGLVSHIAKIENMINIPISYFSDKKTDDGIVFYLNNNENIIKQKGVFTWNASFYKPIEIAGDEQFKIELDDENDIDYKFSQCLNINKNLKEYIVEKIKNDGVTSGSIYTENEINAYHIFEKSKAST